jgi:hypothetical protein
MMSFISYAINNNHIKKILNTTFENWKGNLEQGVIYK